MSINCDDVDRLMERRILRELDEDEARELQDHADRCTSCRSRVAADDAISHALTRMPTVACPSHVVDAIKAATVHQKERKKSMVSLTTWPVFRWKPAWAGMAAAFACIALVLVSRMQRSDGVPFENDPGSAQTASAVVKWSLLYTAQTLQTSQTRVVRQAIAGDLPHTVYSAVSRIPLLKGVVL